MAASIGNLAIVISGNAAPFNNTMRQTQRAINQYSNSFNKTFFNIRDPKEAAARANLDRMRAASIRDRMLNPPSQGSASHLQWGSFGRLARSALVAGFGGGLAGALVGVGAMAFGQMMSATLGVVGEIGSRAASFLADSFQEGLKISRMEMGVNFLAGGPERGGEWLKEIRSLSAVSGYEMGSLGQSMRTLAGSTDELDNVVPTLRAIATVSAGIGAETEQMNRFALAVSQVLAAGRFEAQEINQLTEAGMPIKELAKTAGMSVGQFRRAVKEGEVSVSVLAETFNRMVGPGGRFFGMLEERAKSAVGQVDRLSASWMLFKQDLGKGMLDVASESGLLNAIQGGVQFLLENKGELKVFFKDAVDFGFVVAGQTALITGGIFDLYEALDLVWLKVGGHMKGALELLARVMPGSSSLAPWIMNDAGKMGIGGAGGIQDPLREMFMGMGGRGEQWMRRLEEMRKGFGGVGKAASDAFKPIAVAIELIPRLQKLLDGVQESMASGVTPFDKFTKTLEDVQKIRDFDLMRSSTGSFFDRAFGAASPKMPQGTEDQILANAFHELEKSLHMATEKFPAAMAKGSMDAASAITHAAFGRDNKSVQDRMLEAIRLAKKAQEDTATNTKATADLLRAWRGIPVGK